MSTVHQWQLLINTHTSLMLTYKPGSTHSNWYMFFPNYVAEGANIRMWSADISPKSRRGILRRAVFSEEQRKELERTFRRQKYISKTDRNKLAADLSLKESQVTEYKIPIRLINLQFYKTLSRKKVRGLLKRTFLRRIWMSVFAICWILWQSSK